MDHTPIHVVGTPDIGDINDNERIIDSEDLPWVNLQVLGSIINYHTPELLGDTNWLAWKNQLMYYLKLHKLDGFIDGEYPVPSPLDPGRAIWLKGDQITCLLINSNIKNTEAVHTSQVTTAWQIWENLKAVYETCGQQSITSLRRSLYHARAKETDDIIAHTTLLRNTQVELHQMGS